MVDVNISQPNWFITDKKVLIPKKSPTPAHCGAIIILKLQHFLNQNYRRAPPPLAVPLQHSKSRNVPWPFVRVHWDFTANQGRGALKTFSANGQQPQPTLTKPTQHMDGIFQRNGVFILQLLIKFIVVLHNHN